MSSFSFPEAPSPFQILTPQFLSSFSVQQITGSSPKAPKFEVMVQGVFSSAVHGFLLTPSLPDPGSHEGLVTQALVTRGLPKQYIEVDTSKLKR